MTFFHNKNIWLVGASEGIGRELALQLAKAGARMVVSARNEARLHALVAEMGQGHLAAPCDVTSETSVRTAWAQIGTTIGQIDLLIYNAGTYEPMAADAMQLDAIEQMIDINLRGAYRVLDCTIPAFVEAKTGQIVLVASIAGYAGLPAAMGYSASKAGLISLAETLECDLSRHGIRTQIICPGFVRTRLTEKNDFAMKSVIEVDDAARRMVRGIAGNRFEIRFPWGFSSTLKLLKWMPYWLYFSLMRTPR